MSSSNNNPPPEYFNALARNYAGQTGRVTEALFASCLDEIKPPITASSVIHDNAGGVGTVSSVILSSLKGGAVPEILITDNNAAMIGAALDSFKDRGERIGASEMDSQDLSDLSDDSFTHSIMNFSIFLMPKTLEAIREMHRTLQPGGVAVLSVYSHFGFGHTVHAAQASVRPDLPRMPLPGQHLSKEGVLANLVVEAGFDKDKVQVFEKETVRKGDDLDGMKAFMLKDFAAMATKGWCDNDKADWPSGVEEAFGKEVEKHGGMKFTAWFVIARK